MIKHLRLKKKATKIQVVDKIMETPNIYIFCPPPVPFIKKQGIIIIFLGKIQPWKLEPKTHNL